MEQRSITKRIIFTLITCGIYGLYWIYQLTRDTHETLGRANTASPGMVVLYSIVTCGIYALFWQYKMGEAVVEIQENRGRTADHNTPIIYLVLAVFGLAIVSEAFLQNTLNEVIALDAQQAGSQSTTVLPELREHVDLSKHEENEKK